MKTLLAFALAILGLLSRAPGWENTRLEDAVRRDKVTCAWVGNGRDQLIVTIQNKLAETQRLAIPAGMVAVAKESRERSTILRGSVVAIPANGTVEVALPVAAHSAKSKAVPGQVFEMTKDTDSWLPALIKYLADKPDAPRPTSQLAVLALTDDVNFAQWRTFLGHAADTPPTPAEVTQAIDALGILRVIAPEKAFTLGTDAELKRLALRNPWCRAKAAQLYGLTIPGSDGAVPPDIGQLLHTTPGDNCPICRPRTEMQTSPGGL